MATRIIERCISTIERLGFRIESKEEPYLVKSIDDKTGVSKDWPRNL